MRLFLLLGAIATIVICAFALPVTPEKKVEEDSDVKDDLDEYMEYHRYLKEVVQALESDPDFRERLEKANEEDVRTGKIAEQLDFVNHNVRSRLDEIKRRELERLRHLATKQYELMNNLEFHGKVPSNEHLDHVNPHTFEIEDLKKLIKKTTADLEEADKKRKEEFKQYEMAKEYEKHQKIEKLDEAHKKEFLKNEQQEEEAMKNHKPLNHPGSLQQLEEVWEHQDHMKQRFDPRAFFMMHDLDSNGVWDPNEVKALFITDLDKVYSPNGPNKDRNERAEEMERMREHVFKETDLNKDGLIGFEEFMMGAHRNNMRPDEGWKSIREKQLYTPEEYAAFEKQRLEEMAYLQQRGLVDSNGRVVIGAEHQAHEALKEFKIIQHEQKMRNQQTQQPQQGHPRQQQPQPTQNPKDIVVSQH